MKSSFLKFLTIQSLGFFMTLSATDFTVSSYNCGALSDHYDYVRAVGMHKLTQERYSAEPEKMAQLERIQNLALKILFAPEQEKLAAKQEWETQNYSAELETLLTNPDAPDSINTKWRDRSVALLTDYKTRPITVHDSEVKELLQNQVEDLAGSQGRFKERLDLTIQKMAQRTFHHELKYDIIALQESNYMDASLFPEHYEVHFNSSKYNGIVWNKNRFEQVEDAISLPRTEIVTLRDLQSGETVAIASAHLTGCNPFTAAIDPKTGKADSVKGDDELREVLELLEGISADVKIVAMDSNVTATHPRLNILKDVGYSLDYTNYLEPTCTNPHFIFDTRIDWIAVKSSNPTHIANIPVQGVGLNNPQNNMSDHKPIAARICVE